MSLPDASHCPLCGQLNGCGALRQQSSAAMECWCFNLEIPEPLLDQLPPEQRHNSCVCRRCVEDFLNNRPEASEPVD